MRKPRQYHIVPKVVEAMQNTGLQEDTLAIQEWVESSSSSTSIRLFSGFIVISTDEWDMLVCIDDYVLRDTDGNFRSCDADIFEALYNPA